MAENTEDRKIFLSPRKIPSSADYTLKVPNFFTLPEYDGIQFGLESPSFDFANATWCFQFQSRERVMREAGDGIKSFAIYMKRLNSKIARQLISYTVILLNADDERYKSLSDSDVFDENDERNLMWVPDNEKSSYDTRDTLTLIIHLFDAESTGVKTSQAPITMDRRFTYIMAEKSEDCNISLSSSKATSPLVAYTLKIPNFFTLPEYDNTDFILNSPSFQFADASWCFRFVNRKTKSPTKEFVVNMVRLNSEIPQQKILHHIMLLDADNEVYDEDGDCTCFKKNEEADMWSFDIDKPSYDRRDSLTLMVHLCQIGSSKVDEDHVSVTTDRGIISLAHDFKDVLLNGQDHNLTINVKDKKFRAHQDILRARSEVFRSMLRHDMREKNSGVIDVADCEPEAFEQLLCYLYTGKVETLDKNNVFDLYYAADKYNLPSLKKECYNYIKNSLTLTTVCAALELALKHSDASLLESASSYFFNNLDDILPTVEWQLFMKENLTAANELIIKSVKKLRDTKP